MGYGQGYGYGIERAATRRRFGGGATPDHPDIAALVAAGWAPYSPAARALFNTFATALRAIAPVSTAIDNDDALVYVLAGSDTFANARRALYHPSGPGTQAVNNNFNGTSDWDSVGATLGALGDGATKYLTALPDAADVLGFTATVGTMILATDGTMAAAPTVTPMGQTGAVRATVEIDGPLSWDLELCDQNEEQAGAFSRIAATRASSSTHRLKVDGGASVVGGDAANAGTPTSGRPLGIFSWGTGGSQFYAGRVRVAAWIGCALDSAQLDALDAAVAALVTGLEALS